MHCLYYLFFLNAQSLPLILNDAQNFYDEFTIEYFEDESNALNIEQIEAMPEAFASSLNRFSFGYTSATIWLKIELKKT